MNSCFNRSFSSDLAANVSYAWSQSLDNVSEDSERRVIMTSANPELDRGPSDFDVRHHLTGYISYNLPAPFAHALFIVRNPVADIDEFALLEVDRAALERYAATVPGMRAR